MAKKRMRPRRRPSSNITRARASRLYSLVRLLADSPRTRDQILSALGIGLRTFYREADMLKQVGVRLRLTRKTYELLTAPAEAEERMPFPDPQLTFAEMRELCSHSGPVAQRLAALYREVVEASSEPKRKRPGRGRSRRSSVDR